MSELGIMIEAQSDKDVEVLKQKFVGSNNKNIENQQFDFKSIKNAESESIFRIKFILKFHFEHEDEHRVE